MRSQREVDRDAAVAVLERGDDVTPQVMIRERAREEDERRPLAGCLPGQGPEPGLQSFGFHRYKTYSQYAAQTSRLPADHGYRLALGARPRSIASSTGRSAVLVPSGSLERAISRPPNSDRPPTRCASTPGSRSASWPCAMAVAI